MNIEIANRLVNLRKSSNLSQEALAEKLGISRQAVSKWERAEASPDTDNLILLARLYGVSLDELLQTEDEIPRPEPETQENTSGASTQQTAYTYREEAKVEEPVSSGTNLLSLIVTLSVVMAYLIIGCVWNAWHPGWLMFLLIPIGHSVAECIKYHSVKHFAYPVLAALVYLCLGFFAFMWHPGWVIFITIPLFYAIVNYADDYARDRKKNAESVEFGGSSDEE